MRQTSSDQICHMKTRTSWNLCLRRAHLLASAALTLFMALIMVTRSAQGALPFVNTGSLTSSRYSHTATLLNNGKVLVAGGYNGSAFLASAELYDQATGTWTNTGSLAIQRYQQTATLLS